MWQSPPWMVDMLGNEVCWAPGQPELDPPAVQRIVEDRKRQMFLTVDEASH